MTSDGKIGGSTLGWDRIFLNGTALEPVLGAFSTLQYLKHPAQWETRLNNEIINAPEVGSKKE
jgi:hypothetical protein